MFLPFLDMLLQVTKEEEALAELNVLHECVCKAVTYLLQVEIAQSRCDFLRVKTGTQVPRLVSIVFLDQRVPFRFVLLLAFINLLLHFLTGREHLVKFGALGSHGSFFLSA